MNRDVTRRARADLLRIVDYISNSREQPALDFISEFEDAVDRLLRFPGSGTLAPEYGEGVRKTVIRRRWVMLYRLDGNTLRVLRIIGGR